MTVINADNDVDATCRVGEVMTNNATDRLYCRHRWQMHSHIELNTSIYSHLTTTECHIQTASMSLISKTNFHKFRNYAATFWPICRNAFQLHKANSVVSSRDTVLMVTSHFIVNFRVYLISEATKYSSFYSQIQRSVEEQICCKILHEKCGPIIVNSI